MHVWTQRIKNMRCGIIVPLIMFCEIGYISIQIAVHVHLFH